MASLKLNQYLALLKPAKSTGESALTKVYQNVRKIALLSGVLKTYAPRAEDGDEIAPEGTRLQLRTPEILAGAVAPLTRMLDLVATVDAGNQIAKASVVLEDGQVILEDVPVTTLLFLEKHLAVFMQSVADTQTLDASEEWTWDDDQQWWQNVPSKKHRTKKVRRNHEKAPATDKHPAQVETYDEDTIVGDYTTTLYSGALSETQKRFLLARAAQLLAAVKVAREQANMTVVEDVKIGEKVFDFLAWKNVPTPAAK